jgi:hypothetical protein
MSTCIVIAAKGKFRLRGQRQPIIPRKRKRGRKGEKWRRIAAHRGELLTERIGESSDGKLNRRDRNAGAAPRDEEIAIFFFLLNPSSVDLYEH